MLLKEKRSYGVLSEMNHATSRHSMNMGGAAGDMFSNAAATSFSASTAAAAAPGVAAMEMGRSCLPCDFRSAEVVAALMEDAMVVG